MNPAINFQKLHMTSVASNWQMQIPLLTTGISHHFYYMYLGSKDQKSMIVLLDVINDLMKTSSTQSKRHGLRPKVTTS